MSIVSLLGQSLQITALVFVMMIVIDIIDVASRGRFQQLVRGGVWRQYTVASFLGATPGCLGAFLDVSMYMHGFLSFGAIVAGMIATSGDEAYVMLAKFPVQAMGLFALLFVLAIPLGWVSDRVAKSLRFVPCTDCDLHEIHPEEHAAGHYLREHLWKHIVKGHVWRIFLWTFFALLLLHFGLTHWDLEAFVRQHMGLVLILSVLVGVIPESGPHLIFVMMYAGGMIPFSVLLASSISQDGHGMLPLLSYTVRDSLVIKAFNVVAALLIGGAAYGLGW